MIFSIVSGGLAALFVFFGADMLENNFFSKYHGIAISASCIGTNNLYRCGDGNPSWPFSGKKYNDADCNLADL